MRLCVSQWGHSSNSFLSPFAMAWQECPEGEAQRELSRLPIVAGVDNSEHRRTRLKLRLNLSQQDRMMPSRDCPLIAILNKQSSDETPGRLTSVLFTNSERIQGRDEATSSPR